MASFLRASLSTLPEAFLGRAATSRSRVGSLCLQVAVGLKRLPSVTPAQTVGSLGSEHGELTRETMGRGGDDRDSELVGKDDPGTGIIEDIGGLGSRRAKVQPHGDRSEQVDCQHGLYKPNPVPHDDTDGVRRDHLPSHFGWRFSAKARGPSSASPLEKTVWTASSLTAHGSSLTHSAFQSEAPLTVR